jgi:hypothetical protein
MKSKDQITGRKICSRIKRKKRQQPRRVPLPYIPREREDGGAPGSGCTQALRVAS